MPARCCRVLLLVPEPLQTDVVVALVLGAAWVGCRGSGGGGTRTGVRPAAGAMQLHCFAGGRKGRGNICTPSEGAVGSNAALGGHQQLDTFTFHSPQQFQSWALHPYYHLYRALQYRSCTATVHSRNTNRRQRSILAAAAHTSSSPCTTTLSEAGK